jgi:hypothetical protein
MSAFGGVRSTDQPLPDWVTQRVTGDVLLQRLMMSALALLGLVLAGCESAWPEITSPSKTPFAPIKAYVGLELATSLMPNIRPTAMLASRARQH